MKAKPSTSRKVRVPFQVTTHGTLAVLCRALAFAFGCFLLWMALVVFFMPIRWPNPSPAILAAVYLTIWALAISGVCAIGLAFTPRANS